MYKNDRYLIKGGLHKKDKLLDLDKPIASLSTCHLEHITLGGNLEFIKKN